MSSRKFVLLSAAYPYRGGIAQFTECLADELSKKNTVEVVTFKRQYPGLLFPGKTQYVSASDEKPKILPKRLLDTINPFSYLKTAKQITRLRPEIYISRYWMPFFGPSLGTVARKLKGKCLRLAILDNVIPHERRKFDKTFTKYFVKHHDGFICLSEQVKNELLSIAPDAKVKLINHPIYDQFGPKLSRSHALDKLKLNQDKKYVLFFGFVRKYKGLDLLLEAMATVDETIELIVAGEIYGSFDSYQQIIDKHQLANRVHLFTDYIPDNNVGIFFSACEALVLPYRSATQSGLSAVALSFEVPSIATNVGGLAEVVKNGVNGMVVEPDNPAALSLAINDYFVGNKVELFRENLKKEKEQYSWSGFVHQLESFIEEFK
jgi:glycosyltransferase involved in cell wall biosynthesis